MQDGRPWQRWQVIRSKAESDEKKTAKDSQLHHSTLNCPNIGLLLARQSMQCYDVAGGTLPSKPHESPRRCKSITAGGSDTSSPTISRRAVEWPLTHGMIHETPLSLLCLSELMWASNWGHSLLLRNVLHCLDG